MCRDVSYNLEQTAKAGYSIILKAPRVQPAQVDAGK